MELFFGKIFLKHEDAKGGFLEDLSKNIETRVSNLFKFFNIKSLDKKINIVLWNDVEEFRRFAKSKLNMDVPNWMCGWVQNIENLSIVNTLILEELRKCESHSNNQIHDLENIIIHEIIHIIVKFISNGKKTKKWLTEALATVLSNQQHTFKFKITVDSLYNDNFIDYGTFNLIGQYLLNKTSKDYIISLISDFDFLTAEITKIYVGANLYFDECNNSC